MWRSVLAGVLALGVLSRCAFTLPVLPDTRERYPSWRPSKPLAHALSALADGMVLK